LFKEKKKEFDGFSYFWLTDDEFKEFEEKGIIEKITIYKLIEETDIRYRVNHIFKTKLDLEDYKHWSIIKYNYTRDKCEYLKNMNKNEENI
jgi:predicted transcriptional regulator